MIFNFQQFTPPCFFEEKVLDYDPFSDQIKIYGIYNGTFGLF